MTAEVSAPAARQSAPEINRPAQDQGLQPEANFPTMQDLQAFRGASRVQMQDGINFLSQETGYAGLGSNTLTVRDTTDPAPDGSCAGTCSRSSTSPSTTPA